MNQVVPHGRGLRGAANELHPRFHGAAASFAMVTSLARADHIVPIVFAAEVAGDDMVQGQIPCFLATVLAGVAIPNEYLPLCQLPLQLGPLDQIDEANHRG